MNKEVIRIVDLYHRVKNLERCMDADVARLGKLRLDPKPDDYELRLCGQSMLRWAAAIDNATARIHNNFARLTDKERASLTKIARDNLASIGIRIE